MSKTVISILIVFFLSLTIISSGQERDYSIPKTIVDKKNKEYATIIKQIDSYNLAITFADYTTAIGKALDITLLLPTDSIVPLFISQLYFLENNFQSAYASSKQFLNLFKNNIGLLEINAKSAEELDLLKIALDNYIRLFALTDNFYYKYCQASIELLLGRLTEAEETIKFSLEDKNIDKQTIDFNYTDKPEQRVPLKNALKLLGIKVLYERKDYSKALTSINLLLKEDPDFIEANYFFELITKK